MAAEIKYNLDEKYTKLRILLDVVTCMNSQEIPENFTDSCIGDLLSQYYDIQRDICIKLVYIVRKFAENSYWCFLWDVDAYNIFDVLRITELQKYRHHLYPKCKRGIKYIRLLGALIGNFKSMDKLDIYSLKEISCIPIVTLVHNQYTRLLWSTTVVVQDDWVTPSHDPPDTTTKLLDDGPCDMNLFEDYFELPQPA